MPPVVYAILVPYLILAFDAARRVPVEAAERGFGAQIGLAGAVLVSGLAWPRELWASMRRDWKNHFLD